jgi:hypothetical protein
MTQYKLSFIKKTQVVATKPILKKTAPSPTIKIVKYDKKNYITNLKSHFSYYLIYFYDSSNTLVDISNDLSNVKFSFLKNINSNIRGSNLDYQYSDNELINTDDYYWYWDSNLKALVYRVNSLSIEIQMTFRYLDKSSYTSIPINCAFSKTSLLKNYDSVFKKQKFFIKYKDYKAAPLDLFFSFSSYLPSSKGTVTSQSFMANLHKIDITDYQIIKKINTKYDYDLTLPQITIQFKDISNKLIPPTSSNLNMFIYDITSYSNKNMLRIFNDHYFFSAFNKKNSSSELSNYNDYCINSDKSITIIASIGDRANSQLGIDYELPKCMGLLTYIQFSLGHIFAPTIKLDYKNRQISVI